MAERQEPSCKFQLRWREGKRAPRGMIRWIDAVVDGNTVYATHGGTTKIYSYDSTSDSWSQLPDCVHSNGSLAIINGWLTSIGGNSEPGSDALNELFSLWHTWEGSDSRWTKKFPPMPTKRRRSIAQCIGTTLIVAGGEGEMYDVVSTVEVMDTETHQWSTAADLPELTYLGSAAVCGDQLYVLTGLNHLGATTKSVYACSVSALLQSCVPIASSAEAAASFKTGTSLEDEDVGVWRQVADLPVTHSTCESFHGSTAGDWWGDGLRGTLHSCLHVRLDYQLLVNHQSHDNWST